MRVQFVLPSIVAITILFVSGCGKFSPQVEFIITSPKSGSKFSRPLPLLVKGSIKEWEKHRSRHDKGQLFVYLIEQSRPEGQRWHIEPAAKIDSKGNWKAVTWLGNRKQGKRSVYSLCVFATDKEIPLKNGDHPVMEKPENIGELCIELKRAK